MIERRYLPSFDQGASLRLGITTPAGQDHVRPRLAGPETAVRGRVMVNMAPPHTAIA